MLLEPHTSCGHTQDHAAILHLIFALCNSNSLSPSLHIWSPLYPYLCRDKESALSDFYINFTFQFLSN